MTACQLFMINDGLGPDLCVAVRVQLITFVQNKGWGHRTAQTPPHLALFTLHGRAIDREEVQRYNNLIPHVLLLSLLIIN